MTESCVHIVRLNAGRLRFSGKNMSPLPCWLGGAQNVCLNFSDVDVAVQLHFALFCGSSGYVLKPSGMRFVDHGPTGEGRGSLRRASGGSFKQRTAPSAPSLTINSSCSSSASIASEDARQKAHDGDDYWPPPRDSLDRISIELLSLHNVPKVWSTPIALLPLLSCARGLIAAHAFLSFVAARRASASLRRHSQRGTRVPPGAERHQRTAKHEEAKLAVRHALSASYRRQAPPCHRPALSSPLPLIILLTLGFVHVRAGFCAVSDAMPMPWLVETEITLAQQDNGMNAKLGQEIHCVAAEPHAVFLRVGVADGGHEVAFQTAVLGRLRGGFRIFQLRGVLGTRIELACLFVRISFASKVMNLWPTPRQVRAGTGTQAVGPFQSERVVSPMPNSTD